jgi:hypothetical protein
MKQLFLLLSILLFCAAKLNAQDTIRTENNRVIVGFITSYNDSVITITDFIDSLEIPKNFIVYTSKAASYKIANKLPFEKYYVKNVYKSDSPNYNSVMFSQQPNNSTTIKNSLNPKVEMPEVPLLFQVGATLFELFAVPAASVPVK